MIIKTLMLVVMGMMLGVSKCTYGADMRVDERFLEFYGWPAMPVFGAGIFFPYLSWCGPSRLRCVFF